GGTISGSGTFHVACCGATLAIDASVSDVHLNNAELWNEGTINYTSAGPNQFHMQSSLLTNDGLFDIQSDQGIIADAVIVGFKHKAHTSGLIIGPGGPAISNTGTFQKSGGSGTSHVEPPFTNSGGTIGANAGTLSFTALTQTSGTTTLGGGALAFVNPAQLNGGTLNGAGTITGDVNNTGGNVSPGTSPGTINVTGNYTQGSAGTMTIELGGMSGG